jgi:hypothetical protein
MYEAEMRVIVTILVNVAALAATSVQAAPYPNKEYWLQLGAAPSFEVGDQACGQGLHQSLRRDWRGDWWWGPCVQIGTDLTSTGLWRQ